RAVPQGAPWRWDGESHHRAGAHGRVGCGCRTPRVEDLTSRAPVGVVLAGGRGSRLGGVPKGLERVGGARLLDRVASALGDVTRDLLLVANDSDAASWLPGVPVVADRHPGAGGMAGIEAALAGGRDALVVAW